MTKQTTVAEHGNEPIRPLQSADMSMQDIGPRPQAFDLEAATLANPNYRTVAWSGAYLQVTLMSIPVNSVIGLEKHPATDQFIRLERGRGRAQMGPTSTNSPSTKK